jgi:hypothetical protein
MQSLLASAKRPEGGLTVTAVPDAGPVVHERRDSLPESERRVLAEIQDALMEYGVRADLPELRRTLIDEMFARPSLCRGLVASYLLGEA